MSITETLKQASEGLLWTSESDYPLEPFLWEGENLSTDQLLQKIGCPLDTPVTVVSFDRFFRQATKEEDWYEQEEREEVKRYQKLVETLQQNLSNLQVYRVGTVTVNIYIVGKTNKGKLAGLHTVSIET